MEKKNFILIAAAMLATASFTSCENDAPSINFSQTDTHMTDFTELINAIKDQTLTVAEKLNLINEAINNQALTLGQKMDALKTAMEQGFITEAQKLELIKTAIEGVSNKLEAIEKAIKDQTVSLGAKMDLLTTAVKEGFITEAQKLELIKDAIDGVSNMLGAIEDAIQDQTLSFKAKMDLLTTAVKEGFITEEKELELIQKAIESLGDKFAGIKDAIEDQTLSFEVKMKLLTEAVNDGFISEAQQLELIQKAIATLIDDIYRDKDDAYSVYMKPEVWEVVKNNPEISIIFLKELEESKPTVTPKFFEEDEVTPHVHGGATQLSSTDPILFMDSWVEKSIDNHSQVFAKIVKLPTSATFLVDGRGADGAVCSLAIKKCTYTDVEGNHTVEGAQWNNTQVTFVFYKDGQYKKDASLNIVVKTGAN